MKSLSTTRRITPVILLSVASIILATVVCLIFMVQGTKSSPVNNVSNLFVTDSTAVRPTISSSNIPLPSEPVPAPNTDATTSAAVARTAAAQSTTVGSEVSYPTLQITTSQRDRLFVVASSIVMIGASLYAMTMLSVSPRPAVTRRPLYRALDT